MEERHVTIDGTTYELPPPFLVCATQNPVEFEGTYPLPEAQLDRFLGARAHRLPVAGRRARAHRARGRRLRRARSRRGGRHRRGRRRRADRRAARGARGASGRFAASLSVRASSPRRAARPTSRSVQARAPGWPWSSRAKRRRCSTGERSRRRTTSRTSPAGARAPADRAARSRARRHQRRRRRRARAGQRRRARELTRAADRAARNRGAGRARGCSRTCWRASSRGRSRSPSRWRRSSRWRGRLRALRGAGRDRARRAAAFRARAAASVRLRDHQPGAARAPGRARRGAGRPARDRRARSGRGRARRRRRKVYIEVVPRERGRTALRAYYLRIRTPLGIVELRRAVPAPVEVRVMPDLSALDRGGDLVARTKLLEPACAGCAGAGRRRVRELARVRPDDASARSMESSARRGKPMVATYEVERAQQIVVALDGGRLMSPRLGDRRKLDYAVGAGLAMAAIARLAADRVGVVAFAAGSLARVRPAPASSSRAADRRALRPRTALRRVGLRARVSGAASERCAGAVWSCCSRICSTHRVERGARRGEAAHRAHLVLMVLMNDAAIGRRCARCRAGA